MSEKPELRVDWATHEAAKYACTHWHYSRSLPVGKSVKVGAWEDGRFVGVVIFSWGANKDLGAPYGLSMTECSELVRVALTSHATPVSRLLAVALRFLAKQSPNLRLIVSFADPEAGHHGGIYQAGNWMYAGDSAPTFEYRLNGQRLNKRAFTGNQFGKAGSRASVPPGAVKVTLRGKHRYLMPLDENMRAQILPLSKPYPKRVKKQDAECPSALGGQYRPTRSKCHDPQTKTRTPRLRG